MNLKEAVNLMNSERKEDFDKGYSWLLEKASSGDGDTSAICQKVLEGMRGSPRPDLNEMKDGLLESLLGKPKEPSKPEVLSEVTLGEFWEILSLHDWYHAFSDDHRVYLAGNTNHRRIKSICKNSDEHKKLFDSFVDYYCGGSAFGTKRGEKPSKPKGDAK